MQANECQFYTCHFSFAGVGDIGQQRHKPSHMPVIGADGLGCPLRQYLMATAVG